ncbi:DUF1835 domain-containing protein [Paenibacillaceae bacterium]|nr:DUF1835 domain-containing protein [Paenibacillaceae bacterium]
MLHIVNGDTVADKLRQGVVQGDILVWREVYPHGPVFAEVTALGSAGAAGGMEYSAAERSAAADIEDHQRQARAKYLQQTMGIPLDEYSKISKEQQRSLSAFRNYDEVVLWFEHDLFDQTMLCYLLHWFAGQSLGATRLSLLSIGEYAGIEPFRGLGQLSVHQLGKLSGTWQAIGTRELELGKSLWQAYTASSPEALSQLLREDTSALPFAYDAFQTHLSRFPSNYNGLGIVEQTTLEIVNDGIHAPNRLFGQVGDRLHQLGMGDLQYWHILRRMTQAPCPLLHIQGIKQLPSFDEPAISLEDGEVVLTSLGKRVLRGEADWVLLQGIDEWVGGVHVQGECPRWRWDGARGQIVDADVK